MSPEYLYQLADIADPDELWRRGNITELRETMTENQLRQLDTGVALRRYASHLENVERALHRQESLLITPLSASGKAVSIIETPPQHQRLRDCREKAIKREAPIQQARGGG